MAQLLKQPLLLFIFFVFCLQSCKIKDHNTELEISTEEKYANTIDKENLKKHLYIYMLQMNLKVEKPENQVKKRRFSI